VKACHAMRGALELLDFEDASINDMKRMLLQVHVPAVCVCVWGGGGVAAAGVGQQICTQSMQARIKQAQLAH